MPVNTPSVLAPQTRRALVLGVNGQDGSYLAEHLIGLGWMVFGIGRQPESRWLQSTAGFRYQPLDLGNPSDLSAFLYDLQPEAIFHFAAVHGSAGFCYEDHWRDVHTVNTIAAHAILEYLRHAAPNGTFLYASSSKVFGPTFPSCISESSPRFSRCIYTTTKNAATDLITYYRTRHGIRASVLWTFNHESPRRGASYFIPRIVDSLAQAMQNCDHVAEIETLGFWSDWGDAQEFMDIVTAMVDSSVGIDLLLASGTTLWAEDFADTLFGRFGLERKRHLIEKSAAPIERPPPWRTNLSTLSRAVGRIPVRTIYDVADDILRVNYPQVWAQHTRKK